MLIYSVVFLAGYRAWGLGGSDSLSKEMGTGSWSMWWMWEELVTSKTCMWREPEVGGLRWAITGELHTRLLQPWRAKLSLSGSLPTQPSRPSLHGMLLLLTGMWVWLTSQIPTSTDHEQNNSEILLRLSFLSLFCFLSLILLIHI